MTAWVPVVCAAAAAALALPVRPALRRHQYFSRLRSAGFLGRGPLGDLRERCLSADEHDSVNYRI